MSPRVFAAVDVGASGGRVMKGVVADDRVALEAVHRFPNGVREVDGHLRWDLTEVYRQVSAGLQRIPDAESIGIDTWGVDYGLLDDDGRLCAQPISYRDDRTRKVVDDVHAAVTRDEMFAISGVQFMPFNTIYQLAADRREPQWNQVAHAVLLPDLLAYWLTGALRSELTNASTTGLLDVRTHEWSTELFDRLGLPPGLLPPVEPPGRVRGTTADGIAVTTIASHDTASAVAAVPATTDRFAYVSSGTWSLVGVELDAPVLTPAACAANFTNEIGVDSRIRFLRNVGGLWLLQECLRDWQRNDLDELLDAASCVPAGGPRIDVDDIGFIPPGEMPARIAAAVDRPALTPPETVRCVLDSLAAAYARTVEQAADLAGCEVDVIHIVGGGSQNALLCQLTADAAARPVLAGPVEATAFGNVLEQARTHGALPKSLEAIRTHLAASTELRRYEPS